jgi:Predicted glycosyltransferases
LNSSPSLTTQLSIGENLDTKVLVSLVTGEYIRQASFLPSYIGLQRPPNSVSSTVHGQSPAAGRNIIIKQALENDCTHVFFMDDDMVFPPDTLMKLLKHDKDIVTGLYLLRSFPHRPAFFDQAYPDGKNKFMPLVPGLKGLVEGTNAGLGAALIKTDVFRHLEPPYVRLGEIEKDGWCDDVGFFNRCRAAGYTLWCDLDAPVGHMLTVTLWPENHEGSWYSNYKHNDGNVRINQNVPTLEEIKREEALANVSLTAPSSGLVGVK